MSHISTIQWDLLCTIICCRSVSVINDHQTPLGSPIIIFSFLSATLLFGCPCALKMTSLHSVRTGLCGWAWRRSLDGVVMFWAFWLSGWKSTTVMHPSQLTLSAGKKMILNYICNWPHTTFEFTYLKQWDKNECWDANQWSEDKETAHCCTPGAGYITIHDNSMRLFQVIQQCQLGDRKWSS